MLCFSQSGSVRLSALRSAQEKQDNDKTMVKKQIKQHLNGSPKRLIHCNLAGTAKYLENRYLVFTEVVK